MKSAKLQLINKFKKNKINKLKKYFSDLKALKQIRDKMRNIENY